MARTARFPPAPLRPVPLGPVLLILGLPVLALVFRSAAAPAWAEDGIGLDLRFAAGDRYAIEVVETRRCATTTRGASPEGDDERSNLAVETRTSRVAFLLEIDAVGEEGTAHAELRVLSISLVDRTSEGEISLRAAVDAEGTRRIEASLGVGFDAGYGDDPEGRARTETLRAGLEGFLEDLGGDLLDLVAELDLEPTGAVRVVAIRGDRNRNRPGADGALGAAAEALRSTLALEDLVRARAARLLPVLPVAAVDVGDTWEIERRLTSGGLVLEGTGTATLTNLDGARARVESVLRARVDAAGIAERSRRIGRLLLAPYGGPHDLDLTFEDPGDVVLACRAGIDVARGQVLAVTWSPVKVQFEGRMALTLLSATHRAGIEVVFEWESRATWTRG